MKLHRYCGPAPALRLGETSSSRPQLPMDKETAAGALHHRSQKTSLDRGICGARCPVAPRRLARVCIGRKSQRVYVKAFTADLVRDGWQLVATGGGRGLDCALVDESAGPSQSPCAKDSRGHPSALSVVDRRQRAQRRAFVRPPTLIGSVGRGSADNPPHPSPPFAWAKGLGMLDRL